MNFLGVVTLHPLTVPIGNELTFCVTQLIKHSWVMYSSVVIPELQELRIILDLLNS